MQFQKKIKIFKTAHKINLLIVFDARHLRWAFARPSTQTEYTVGGRAAELIILMAGWVGKFRPIPSNLTQFQTKGRVLCTPPTQPSQRLKQEARQGARNSKLLF